MGFWTKLRKTKQQRKLDKKLDKELAELEDDAKEAILGKFTISDMESTCHEYGIDKPYHRGGRAISLWTYTNYLKNKIELTQLEKIAIRRKVNISMIISEYKLKVNEITKKYYNSIPSSGEDSKNDTIGRKLLNIKDYNEFKETLQDIRLNFKPEEVRDEEELEKLLVQFLKIRYPDKDIERQVSTLKGRIDVVIGGKYGIEIKIAESKEKLRNLVGQIEDYCEVPNYQQIAAVVLDIGKLSSEDINEYAKKIEKLGASFLTITGYLKRKDTRPKFIVKHQRPPTL